MTDERTRNDRSFFNPVEDALLYSKNSDAGGWTPMMRKLWMNDWPSDYKQIVQAILMFQYPKKNGSFNTISYRNINKWFGISTSMTGPLISELIKANVIYIYKMGSDKSPRVYGVDSFFGQRKDENGKLQFPVLPKLKRDPKTGAVYAHDDRKKKMLSSNANREMDALSSIGNRKAHSCSQLITPIRVLQDLERECALSSFDVAEVCELYNNIVANGLANKPSKSAKAQIKKLLDLKPAREFWNHCLQQYAQRDGDKCLDWFLDQLPNLEKGANDSNKITVASRPKRSLS